MASRAAVVPLLSAGSWAWYAWVVRILAPIAPVLAGLARVDADPPRKKLAAIED